jgi:hypothetical protein
MAEKALQSIASSIYFAAAIATADREVLARAEYLSIELKQPIL